MEPEDLAEPQPVDVWKPVLGLVSVLITSLLYSAMLGMVPAFEGLFSGFGADLPWITKAAFSVYPWYGILIPVGLIPSVVLLMNRRRSDADRLMTVIVVSFTLSFLLFGLFVYAIYAPVFKMGAVV